MIQFSIQKQKNHNVNIKINIIFFFRRFILIIKYQHSLSNFNFKKKYYFCHRKRNNVCCFICNLAVPTKNIKLNHMRKLVLLLACFLGFTAFSQIKVLKNETLIEIGKDNAVGLYKKENKYTFNYQDINTSNLNTFRSFSFNDINGDVQGLYKLITDGFIDQPSGNITLELPNDIIELHFEKNYGQPTVQFVQFINKNKKYVGKSQFLTKKQIDRIFGVGTSRADLYNKPAVKQGSVNTVNAASQTTKTSGKTSTKTKKTRR